MPTTTIARLLVLALAGCAPRTPADPAASSAGDCFDASRVAGWESAGANHVRVRVNGRQTYDLGLQGPRCEDIGWSPTLAIESNAGSPWVCVGDGAGLGEVRFQDGPSGPTVICRIDSVSRSE